MKVQRSAIRTQRTSSSNEGQPSTPQKKVLITGGAGFIGSHVADRFAKEGWKVVVVDDFSSGKPENVPAGAKVLRCDITDPAVVDLIAKEKPDVVCHQAAQISVSASMKDPLHDSMVNVLGTHNVMRGAIAAGTVKQVITAGSGGTAYGTTEQIPTPETHPTAPESHYGASKLHSESIARIAGHENGMNVAVVRYANVYGPRQDPHGEAGVVAIWFQKMLKGEQPMIFGDGEQKRDFVYVGDVAEANFLAAQRGYDGTVNVATGEETSVNELFAEVARAAGTDAAPQYGPPRAGDLRRSALDVGKARAELGWSPKVSLRDGLSATFAYFAGRAEQGKKDAGGAPAAAAAADG